MREGEADDSRVTTLWIVTCRIERSRSKRELTAEQGRWHKDWQIYWAQWCLGFCVTRLLTPGNIFTWRKPPAHSVDCRVQVQGEEKGSAGTMDKDEGQSESEWLCFCLEVHEAESVSEEGISVASASPSGSNKHVISLPIWFVPGENRVRKLLMVIVHQAPPPALPH